MLEGILFNPRMDAGRFFLLEVDLSCSRVSIASWSCFCGSREKFEGYGVGVGFVDGDIFVVVEVELDIEGLAGR